MVTTISRVSIYANSIEATDTLRSELANEKARVDGHETFISMATEDLAISILILGNKDTDKIVDLQELRSSLKRLYSKMVKQIVMYKCKD